MDLRKLKTLIDLVSDSNITELEITEADGRVRIVKGEAPVVYAPAAAPRPSAEVAPPAATASDGAVQTAVETAPPAPAGHVVKSPMVGTFYRSSAPGGKALADVGAQVQTGQALCIIEAMKIMNEIESDKAGKVTRILCENGQAVEFGQPLFIIE